MLHVRHGRRLAAGMGVSLIALMSGSSPVYAQGDEEAASDEIIVSARRRDESLQDVPVAVTAFSGDALDQIGAADLTTLQDITPNVTLEATRATNNTIAAFIRGVGQQDPVAGFEGGVGIYLDDIYLNRPQAAVLDIYDVERIEVLRGPQGTLYGRNTIGGAVKYVTRRLSDDPSAMLRVTGGNYGQFDAVGVFSLPLLDDSAIGDLKIGGGVAYLTRNGYGDNINIAGLENYNKDILAGRGSVEWDPTENFSIRFAGDWTVDKSDPKQGHRLRAYDFPVGGVVEYPVLADEFDTRSALNSPTQKVEARGISNTVEFRATDSLTFRNILSYRDDYSTVPIDFDSLPIVDVDVPGIYANHQFTEEVQAAYEGDWLSGILGFYYLNATAKTHFDAQLSTLTVFTSANVGTETWSAFGDLTFDISDQFSLAVGGRYTQDDRSMFLLRQVYSFGFSPFFGGPPRAPLATQTNIDVVADFSDFSPRASIAWKPSDEHNLYLSYAQGFKGGSFDPRCVAVTAPNIDGDAVAGSLDIDDQRAFCLFQPEDINTFEVGLKSNWDGGRYWSNFAVFLSDYKNVQIPGSYGVDTNGDGIADTFAGVTTNAAAATLWGIEWEGMLGLARDFLSEGDGLNFQFSLGYINAEFDEYLGRGSPPPDVTNIAEFQNTPKVTASGRLSYDRPLGLFGADGDVNLYTSFSYRSLTHQFNFVTPLDQPGYALFNAGFSWTGGDGHVTVGLHGTNLADKRYVTAGYDFVTVLPAFANTPLGASGVQTVFFGDPRRFFGTVQLRF
ncbi:MAG: TonB-dependent receptor [Parvularculaceae bacterium]